MQQVSEISIWKNGPDSLASNFSRAFGGLGVWEGHGPGIRDSRFGVLHSRGCERRPREVPPLLEVQVLIQYSGIFEEDYGEGVLLRAR